VDDIFEIVLSDERYEPIIDEDQYIQDEEERLRAAMHDAWAMARLYSVDEKLEWIPFKEECDRDGPKSCFDVLYDSCRREKTYNNNNNNNSHKNMRSQLQMRRIEQMVPFKSLDEKQQNLDTTPMETLYKIQDEYPNYVEQLRNVFFARVNNSPQYSDFYYRQLSDIMALLNELDGLIDELNSTPDIYKQMNILVTDIRLPIKLHNKLQYLNNNKRYEFYDPNVSDAIKHFIYELEKYKKYIDEMETKYPGNMKLALQNMENLSRIKALKYHVQTLLKKLNSDELTVLNANASIDLNKSGGGGSSSKRTLNKKDTGRRHSGSRQRSRAQTSTRRRSTTSIPSPTPLLETRKASPPRRRAQPSSSGERRTKQPNNKKG